MNAVNLRTDINDTGSASNNSLTDSLKMRFTGDGFSKVMDSIGKIQQDREARSSSPSNDSRRERRNSEKPKESRRDVHSSSRETNVGKSKENSNKSKAEVGGKERETSKTERVAQDSTNLISSEVGTQIDTANNDIVNGISQILEVDIQTVTDILNILNMTPLDLMNKGNMNMFMQKIFGVENGVELLGVENISDMMKDINNIFEQISSVVTSETLISLGGEQVNQANLLAQITIQTSDEASNSNEISTTGNSRRRRSNTPATNTHTNSQLAQEGVMESEPELGLGEASSKLNYGVSSGVNSGLDSRVRLGLEQSEVGSQMQPEDMDTTEMLSNNNSSAGQNSSQNGAMTRNLQNINSQVPGTEMDLEATSEFKIGSTSNNTTESAAKINKPTPMSNLDTRNVINQIVNKMKVDVRGNLTEMRITLNPENLGDVSLRVAVQNGIVTAQFLAESQRVKEIIESNFELLKESLQKQGIEVSELSVNVGSEDSESRMNQFRQSRQKSARRIQQIMDSLNNEEISTENYSKLEDVLDNTVNYTA